MTMRQCDLAGRAQNSGSMFLYTRPTRDADDEFLDSLFDKQWRKEGDAFWKPHSGFTQGIFSTTSPMSTTPRFRIQSHLSNSKCWSILPLKSIATDNPFKFYVTRQPVQPRCAIGAMTCIVVIVLPPFEFCQWRFNVHINLVLSAWLREVSQKCLSN